MSKLVCYIYTAFYDKRDDFEIVKNPHLAERIKDSNKYQVLGYSKQYQFYSDTPQEWIWDIDKKNETIMIDYITLDPNAEQKFKDKLIRILMGKLLKVGGYE